MPASHQGALIPLSTILLSLLWPIDPPTTKKGQRGGWMMLFAPSSPHNSS
nr:MAG TPA: hypothetical protein [Caudoviricetes sp.]